MSEIVSTYFVAGPFSIYHRTLRDNGEWFRPVIDATYRVFGLAGWDRVDMPEKLNTYSSKCHRMIRVWQ